MHRGCSHRLLIRNRRESPRHHDPATAGQCAVQDRIARGGGRRESAYSRRLGESAKRADRFRQSSVRRPVGRLSRAIDLASLALIIAGAVLYLRAYFGMEAVRTTPE